MTKIIKNVFIALIWFISVMVAMYYDESIGLLIFEFGLCMILIVMIGKFIYFNNNWIINDEYKRFDKSNTRRLNLFSWAGEEVQPDVILFDLLKNHFETGDLISNLLVVKDKLKMRLGANISNYYLIYNYLKLYEKNNLSTFLRKFFSVFILGGLTSIIIPSFIKGINVEKFMILFTHQKDTSVLNSINMLTDAIYYLFVISALYLMIVLFYRAFSKSKKRIQLLIIVIETLIQEKEKELS